MNIPFMNTSTLDSPHLFLHAVLEGFIDGILVLTEQQKIIYANAKANTICAQLPKVGKQALPKDIQRICHALIESRELYRDHPVILEFEVATPTAVFRIRAQWLVVEAIGQPCLLLRLQDENQSVQGLAIAEAQNWGLTPRETEVWLLRRAGHSRKAIAADLYIAIDTVKKHLKNVHLKRQLALDEEQWQANQAS